MRVNFTRPAWEFLSAQEESYLPIVNELLVRAKAGSFAYCEVGPSDHGLRIGASIANAFPGAQGGWCYVEHPASLSFSNGFRWMKEGMEKDGVTVLTTGLYSQEVRAMRGAFDLLVAANFPFKGNGGKKKVLSQFFELLREGGELMLVCGQPVLVKSGPTSFNGYLVAQRRFTVGRVTRYVVVGRNTNSAKNITLWQRLKWWLFGIF